MPAGAEPSRARIVIEPMKITLNLAIAPSARERYALHWTIPAMVLGVAGLVFLLTSTYRSFREYKAAQKSLTQYQEQENEIQAREMTLRQKMEEPNTRRLITDAQFVNTLIEKKRFTLTDVATDLTGLMPDEVRLTALSVDSEQEGLLIRFVIAAKSEAGVEHFLSSLEDSPHFKDVAIVNEGFEQEGNTTDLENIACTAYYLIGEGERAGE